MPLSKSQKGALFEWGLTSLTLLFSRGSLQLATPSVDEADVDRVLTRPRSHSAAFLQLKTRSAPVSRGILELHFDPIDDAAHRHDLYLIAGELLPHSPWVGPRFAAISAPDLPAAHRGRVNLSIPLRRGTRSRWAPFVHDRSDLARIFADRLDLQRQHPYSVPDWVAPPLRSLSPRARGFIIEREVAAHALFHSDGRLNLWSPLVDDFGEDFAVTDAAREAAIRLQPKGSFGLTAGGQIDVKVPVSTFRPQEFDFLVFCNYDPQAPGMSPHAFVMRADEFAEHVRAKRGYLRFNARPDPKKAGKWAPWLYRVEEIAGVLETALAVRRLQGAGASLPARRNEVAEARHALRGARRARRPRG